VNIIHRDIRIENLLINKDGIVKIKGFKNAAYLTKNTTLRDTSVGKTENKAPEMIRPEEGYDRKVDVWAFGILAYKLATGNSPWENTEEEFISSEISLCSNEGREIKKLAEMAPELYN
jgi:serine/threonine protein kinase